MQHYLNINCSRKPEKLRKDRFSFYIKTLRKNILTNRWLTNPTSYFKVKLEALNRYGQNLWEMEFFTNTCMLADPLEWLADDHVLYQTGLNLSVRYDMCLK